MVLTLVLLPALAPLLDGGAQASVAAVFDCPSSLIALAITVGKVAAFVTVMLVVGRRRHPVAAALRCPHRLARTVPARGARHRARRGLRRGPAVRRVVRARRVLRRHDVERIGAQPAGRRGDAAAARRLRGAVLRLGRHAVRPRDPRPRSAAGAGDARHHRPRQVARGLRHRARMFGHPLAPR